MCVTQQVPLVVSINVHELSRFVLLQLQHIHAHLPFGHCVLLNCSEDMHAALRHELPSAFVWDASKPAAATLCHPQPLNKRRFHGSLLRGIVRNMEFASRRWDFDAFLVLSSRSWFRRPLSPREAAESCARVPPAARRAQLRYTEAGMQFVDASHTSKGLEVGTDASGKPAMVGHDWWPLLRTRLAYDTLAAHAIVQGPHEGLLLERAACAHALSVLGDGPVAADLWKAEAPVEEFALQSLAHSQGLRFAQLSDMGERDGLGNGLDAAGADVPPLTKVERCDPGATSSREPSNTKKT